MTDNADQPTPPVVPPEEEPGDRPRITFEHWFFNKLEDVHFQKSDQSGEPVMIVHYAKNPISMTFKGIMKEFKIPEDSHDGQMLEIVAKSLKFFKAMRIGEMVPKEITSREASWDLSQRHIKIAYQRISVQLVNWMTGGQSVITDPEELLQLADDPQTKKTINEAFGEAAEKLGLGRDNKEKVVAYVEQLAHELAYIEALRDRFRKICDMEEKIQTLRRVYGRERSVMEVADQVARLGERAVAEFNDLFLEVDAQTGEILSVLRNLQAQIGYIRDKRDELYSRLMAWDEILGQWAHAQLKVSPENPELLRRTYQFLAPRFMMVKEWVLMSKLMQQQSGKIKAVSQMGGPELKGKKAFQAMRW